MYRPHPVATFVRDLANHSLALRTCRRGLPNITRSNGLVSILLAQLRTTTTATSSGQGSKAPNPSSKIHLVSPTEYIAKQRLNRPVVPSLAIYSWEIMICGALHRNTGILLSGTMYIFGFSYLVLPIFGIPFGSAEVVAWFGSLPLAVKMLAKWTYGFAFSFHFAHGLKHLVWDTGAMLTNAQVKTTAVAALAAGALGATGLCFI